MGIPTNEQETTISFSRDEAGAEIWTSDSTVMTKLDRLADTSPEYWTAKEVQKSADGELLAKVYVTTDKSMISFRSKKTKLDLTEEQRAKMAERLKRGRVKSNFDLVHKEQSNENFTEEL